MAESLEELAVKENQLEDNIAKLDMLSLQENSSLYDNINNSIVQEDYVNSSEWKEKKKHIFILSSAGKPVYSRYGSEDKLVTMFGVMQALVSFVQDSQDIIRSIHAGDLHFVFLLKGPIILVSVSRLGESEEQMRLQLSYVYNQVVSVLTLSQLTKIFEQRRNFDLRRLLAGSERLIDHLLAFTESQPEFLLGAVRCLPLPAVFRYTISSTIISCCSKIKNLVFAILLAEDQLITLVRMKKYNLQASDLHLIFNMVSSSESFKTAESWTPICLPNFDSSGFLHGHVSYLAEDCQACLLLLTVDRDLFYTLSEAKGKIVEKLRRNKCLEAINEALSKPKTTPHELNVISLRHCLYKCKATNQLWSPSVEAPYQSKEEATRLLQLYQSLHHALHRKGRTLKLFYQQLATETMLGWITVGFELYVTFEPLVTKPNCINAVNKILRWIKREEERLFISNSPTF